MAENIICECGMLIKGTTKKHLQTNLKSHKRGNKHKDIMKIKEVNEKNE